MVYDIDGKIKEGFDYDSLYIGEDCLADFAEDFNGCTVKLKYYISDTPITKENAVEKFLKSFYEGFSDSDGTYVSGSSWTGVYAKNDDFEVGGHDIIEELRGHIGKYCYLEVETNED